MDFFVQRDATVRSNRKHPLASLGHPIPLFAFGLLCACLSCPVQSVAADRSTVDCYDSGRDLVREVLPSECHGEIVSRARAEEIRAERVKRVQRALASPAPAPLAGAHIVRVGSGFFVTENGWMLTNRHVIDGCRAVTVEPPNSQRVTARVETPGPLLDLALLKTQLISAAHAFFRVQTVPKAGQAVLLVGYPDQGLPTVRPVVTFGTLLPPAAKESDPPYLVVRADVRPGDSGGPLLDQTGLVVGIVTAKVNTVNVYREKGWVVRNVGIALSSMTIVTFLAEAKIPYSAEAAHVLARGKSAGTTARAIVARVECWR